MLKQLSHYSLINLMLIFTVSCDSGSCSESFISNDTKTKVVVIAYSYNTIDTIAQLPASTKSESFRSCRRGEIQVAATIFGWSEPDSVDIVFNDSAYLRYSVEKVGCTAKNPLCSHHYHLVREEGSVGFFEYRITQADFEAAKPF